MHSIVVGKGYECRGLIAQLTVAQRRIKRVRRKSKRASVAMSENENESSLFSVGIERRIHFSRLCKFKIVSNDNQIRHSIFALRLHSRQF